MKITFSDHPDTDSRTAQEILQRPPRRPVNDPHLKYFLHESEGEQGLHVFPRKFTHEEIFSEQGGVLEKLITAGFIFLNRDGTIGVNHSSYSLNTSDAPYGPVADKQKQMSTVIATELLAVREQLLRTVVVNSESATNLSSADQLS